VIVWASGGRVFGRAPAVLSGLLEVRGQCMTRSPTLRLCQIAAVAALRSPQERQPAPRVQRIAGLDLPAFEVAALEPSAPARLRRIVEGFDASL